MIRLILSPMPPQGGGKGPESVQRIGSTEGYRKTSQLPHTRAHRESGRICTAHWGNLELTWKHLQGTGWKNHSIFFILYNFDTSMMEWGEH